MGTKRGRMGFWSVALLALTWAPASALPSSAPTRSVSASALTEMIGSLRSDLEAILRAAWRSSRWSVLAVSLDRGDTLFAENADAALVPASNMKLLTTATAIQRLGSSFRYQTFLLASGPVRSGQLEGDLILYGTGDPGISSRFQPGATAVFEAFADSLLAAGVYAVNGDVVGDGSYFSGPLIGDGWNPDDLNDSFAAPSGALSFNENVFQLRVRSSGAAGSMPEILTLPENAGVPVLNSAIVGGSGPLIIRRLGPLEPITIQGGVAPGAREVWRQMTVQDPAHFAASVLRHVLERKGIRVNGAARASYDGSKVTGRRLWAPATGLKTAPRVLARHLSPPLIEYLVVVNKRSHNLLADQILKTVGRVEGGDGSFQGGARVVSHFMTDSVGAASSELAIHDGSGLSTLNRVSAADFVSLMSYMARSGDWNTLWETLPEAGNPRELRRMYGSAAAGNLRAKTGTIQNVSSLSGMVRSASGERIAFSIIVNDAPSTRRAKGIEDQIGTRLASFDRPQQVDALQGVLAEAAPDSSASGAALPAQTNEPVVEAADGDAANGADGTTPAVPTSPTPESARRHQVQAGENFSVIARRYGLGVDALLEANPDVPVRRLQPGMWVRIP